MDAVKDVDANFLDEIFQNIITYGKLGLVGLTISEIVKCSDEYVVIELKALEELRDDLKQIWLRKNTPTSASPQG
jgi:hypothetical protein